MRVYPRDRCPTVQFNRQLSGNEIVLAKGSRRYLTAHLPNQPQGTLRFDLASPGTVFGFNIMDVGEVTGTVSWVQPNTIS